MAVPCMHVHPQVAVWQHPLLRKESQDRKVSNLSVRIKQAVKKRPTCDAAIDFGGEEALGGDGRQAQNPIKRLFRRRRAG